MSAICEMAGPAFLASIFSMGEIAPFAALAIHRRITATSLKLGFQQGPE